MQRTNKALDTGLASLMKAPGALLMGVKAQGTFSRESEKPGQESEQYRSLCSRESAKEGEREREREREREKDPSSNGVKVLY